VGQDSDLVTLILSREHRQGADRIGILSHEGIFPRPLDLLVGAQAEDREPLVLAEGIVDGLELREFASWTCLSPKEYVLSNPSRFDVTSGPSSSDKKLHLEPDNVRNQCGRGHKHGIIGRRRHRSPHVGCEIPRAKVRRHGTRKLAGPALSSAPRSSSPPDVVRAQRRRGAKLWPDAIRRPRLSSRSSS